ncbi:MAG TPA: hypothetical protein VHI52_18135 [Verrucomicrobiae bacterium]|nr:hypothetical protein [Verrucomicrobiae bacterium]
MKTGKIVILGISLCFAAYLYTACKPVWQFDSLERNARKVITGSELQAWAVALLAKYATNTTLSWSEMQTNFPQQLRGLAPKLGPYVIVNRSENTNSPTWVHVAWGSGFLGATGFEIGSTNFQGLDPKGHAWQPGVYFYRR